MFHSFSTDHIPASDRQEAWLWNAKQFCGDCNFQFPKKNPFHGTISRKRLADMEMTLFASSALAFHKYPVFTPARENRAFIVITQLQGIRRYCQNGLTAVLRKGDATLIDTGVPWSSECNGDCARLYLRVPQVLLGAAHPDLPFARRIPGDSGLGAILYQLSTSLFEHAEQLDAIEGHSAIEGYLRVLTAFFGSNVAREQWPNRAAELSDQILGYIERHLMDTTLGPAEIAAALGISVRHVHRVFEHQGSTIADWIRTRRLKRCQTDLCDPRLKSKSITEIAFYWGFNDSAHFSHAFKREFRVCPRLFRSKVTAGLAVEPSLDEGLQPADVHCHRDRRAN
jgi:AraC-like DNA-binding protein